MQLFIEQMPVDPNKNVEEKDGNGESEGIKQEIDVRLD